MKVKIGKYKEDRKIEIKIHDYDVWNLDHTLALIIHPCLVKLKEVKHGSPQVDNSDVPTKLHGVVDKFYNDSTVHEKWEWVLDELIWTFEQISKDDCGFYKNDERVENGLRLFGKYYRGLWD